MHSSKKWKTLLLTIVVFAVGTGIGLTVMWEIENGTADITATTDQSVTAAAPTQSILPKPQKILTKEQFESLITPEDQRLGQTDAPITIIEFSDFQCPYCKDFFDTTFGLLKTTYIDTGKVQLIYKHFPLTKKHPQALPAAKTFECTDTEKQWDMHDLIFNDSSAWNGNDNALEIFTGYAAQLGLDTAAFKNCMEDPATETAVMADQTAGLAVGVKATPSFIINANLYKGALSFVKLQSIISSLLKE